MIKRNNDKHYGGFIKSITEFTWVLSLHSFSPFRENNLSIYMSFYKKVFYKKVMHGSFKKFKKIRAGSLKPEKFRY